MKIIKIIILCFIVVLNLNILPITQTSVVDKNIGLVTICESAYEGDLPFEY